MMHSFSDSSIAFWNSFFQWAVAVSGGIALFSSICLIFVTSESGKRQESRVATLTRDTENAKKEAAQATERAAEAVAKGNGVEQQNIVLRTDLAKVQTEAANAQRMLLGVQAETKSMKQDVGAIQSHMKPRTLTQDQRDSIVRLLHTFPRLEAEVMYSPQTSEASAFCQQLRDVVAMAGWGVPDKIINNMGITCPVDVRFEVGDKGQVPQSVLALAKTLTEMGFVVAGQEQQGLPSNHVVLRVGDRTTVEP